MYVVVYNGLGVSRSTVVHLPVSSDGTYRITKVGSSAEETKVASLPVLSTISTEKGAEYVVHFDTGPLPPLGANVYNITLDGNGLPSLSLENVDMNHRPFVERLDHRRVDEFVSNSEDVEASNGIFSVLFDG